MGPGLSRSSPTVGAFLLGASIFAAPAAALDSGPGAARIVELEPLPVGTDGVESPDLGWSPDTAAGSPQKPPSERLETIPGLTFARRGAFSDEPMLSGMGSDRVATVFGGLRLPSGSPTRTDAPIHQFGGAASRSLGVISTLPSLTLGPPVSAGWIHLAPTLHETAGNLPKPGVNPSANLFLEADLNRGGGRAEGSLTVLTAAIGAEFSFFQTRVGNYRAGDGREIPSRHEDAGASLSAYLRTGRNAGTLHTFDALHRRQFLNENASLPLDTVGGDSHAVAASHAWPTGDNDHLRLRYGYAESRTRLDNSRRHDIPLFVRNRAETRSGHADLRWHRRGTDRSSWEIGFDTNFERRLAVRKRGGTARDFIWPGIRAEQGGVFAETRRGLGESGRLRLGLRCDRVRTRARRLDETAFGLPLSFLYQYFNDIPESSSLDARTEAPVSANVLYQGRLSDHTTIHLGLGSTAQTAPPTERYRALLPALGGGFEIGNPSLVAERKTEIVAGIEVASRWIRVRLDGFAYAFDDYIWHQRVGSTADLLPDDPPQVVHGYRNVDTRFAGVNLAGMWRASRELELPFALAWVQARIREDGAGFRAGDHLPELPPASARVGLVYRRELRGHPLRLQWTGRWIAGRDNPLPELAPLYSDSASAWLHDFAFGFHSDDERWVVQLSLRNAFDTLHLPYLAPPLFEADGPGSPLPAPGREWSLSCRLGF